MAAHKTKPKKTTHIPKKPTYVYVSYKSDCVNVIEDTLGEDGPYSGFKKDAWDFALGKAFVTPPNYTPYWEHVELVGAVKAPDHVYVLYVRYSDGNTFGRSSGLGAIVKAYVNEKDAIKDQQLIKNGKYPGYCAWTGYFSNSGYNKMIEPLNFIYFCVLRARLRLSYNCDCGLLDVLVNGGLYQRYAWCNGNWAKRQLTRDNI